MFKYNRSQLSPVLVLLLSMMSSCSVDKCRLTFLTVSEALALSARKVKLEMQTLQTGKAFWKNAFKDKCFINGSVSFNMQYYISLTETTVVIHVLNCRTRERFHSDFSVLIRYSIFFNTRYNGITENTN